LTNEIGRISYLTSVEYFYLVSTYFSAAQAEYNCDHCLKKYAKSYRDKKKFCTIEKSTPVTDYHGSIKYFKCPGNFFNEGYALIIESYRRYNEGILPYSGGLFEQPAKIIEAFSVIRSLDSENAKDNSRSAKKVKPTKRR
jgi:hypothetical protein